MTVVVRYRRTRASGVRECVSPTAAYAREAILGAIEMGMTRTELDEVLSGSSPTVLVPPVPNEDPAAYGCRAASEIMTRYAFGNPHPIPVDAVPPGPTASCRTVFVSGDARQNCTTPRPPVRSMSAR